jgi:hypothetical protein
MNETRGNLYLLTGLILGIGLGLLIAWVISPVRYVDTDPALMAPAVKEQYRQVIALAYQSSGDLGRARQRLGLVDPGSSFQSLAAQAQRMLAEGTSSKEARALALLAADLNNPTPQGEVTAVAAASAQPTSPTGLTPTGEPASASATETPQEVAAIQTATPLPSPTVSPTPAPTFTPRPTATPRRALEAPFILKKKQEVCGAGAAPGLLQIFVTGSDGEPLPGVQILITARETQDTFSTGLYPEISPGYADFGMAAGEVYSLKIGDVSEVEVGITIPFCGGGLQMEFEEGKN